MVSSSPVVYIQTSVEPDLPVRSSLKASTSSPGSMRPTIEEPKSRGVAESKVFPWSSVVCAPTPTAFRMRKRKNETDSSSNLAGSGRDTDLRTDTESVEVSLKN